MGVHELWPILEPVKKHVPLQSLAGKTLAVDLSIWVCEAQSVKQMVGVVAKPHLRNLFFRVSSLNSMGVKLVFVTEGEAPKVKADTMNKRNKMRYGASKKIAPARPGRSYFKSVLKECLRMLDCLGVPWVQAAGEAEAMCAYLDANGYVDGCITNDGDVFLYGAQTVYRNFTMNVKDPHVDCYKVSAINARLGLDRESLVGLAILLGCDYVPKGLPGVGRELAMKFIKSLNGEGVLQRFHQWRRQFDDPALNSKPAKKKVHCTVCSHPGSAKEHERKGCTLCGSEKYCEPHDYDYCCPCDWHKAEQEKQNCSLEYTFKMKAKKREGFPYPEVIEEFLINKDKLVKVIKWMRPSLLCFQNFALERMEWPKHYSCEKVLSLLTYYDMHERKAGRLHGAQLQAVRIIKTRVRNGIPCFEIEWVKPAGYVFPDDHPPDGALLTIEEESLFTGAYPPVVELFQKDKLEAEVLKQRCKKSKSKPKVPSNVDDVASLLSEMSLTPTVETNASPLIVGASEEPEITTCLEGHQQSNDLHGTEEPSPPMVTWVSRVLDIPTTPVHIEDDLDVLDEQCFSPAPGHKPESSVASPNVSSMVAELHLSSIDWEATSFSMSPQAESWTGGVHIHGVQVGQNPGEPAKEACNANHPAQEIVGPNKNAKDEPPVLTLADSPCISHLEKLPLRERLLLKNATRYASSEPPDALEKRLPLKPIPRILNMRDVTKSGSNQIVSSKENIQTYKPAKSTKEQSAQNIEKQVNVAKKPDPNCWAPDRPTTKTFTFVKKIPLVPARLAPVNNSSKMASESSAKGTQKKSVCLRAASSSEDEQEAGGRPKQVFNKERTKSKMPVSKMAPVRPATSIQPDTFSIPSTDNVFSSSEGKVLSAESSEELSDDDSIISVDSPLPLSERLKLRLLHNS
ncbi:flap endonuclease GEN homolog 1 [Bufo bufo]|uniref:flap endonuclease GEN homolog 1 n=1 Tax=Bufo bufo TaxID=8384 RepID=UPI001ABE6DBA|nr:flap endonuclease GEN homolog 1 [Bufo bufo]